MENLLENKLTEELREGVLNGSRLASVLLKIVSQGRLFNVSRRELAAELTSSPMPKIFIDENNKAEKSDIVHFSDLRFLGVSLAGIKKYPVRSDSLKYGLSFSRDGMPVNSIFIGANGVGKTSIYSALEYAGMGKTNSALAHGYEIKKWQTAEYENLKEDQSAFLIHSGAERKDVSLSLFTTDKDIILEGEDFFNHSEKQETPEVFYCSNYDVRELETSEDYTRFMLRQIGLDQFYYALQLLYYLGVYVKSEQKKSEDSIWHERKNRPIWRLMLKIALGYSGEMISFDMKNNDLLLLKNVIDKNQDVTLIKNCTEQVIKSVKFEKGKYGQNDWFSTGVIEQYSNLLNLLVDFQNKGYSFEGSEKNDLLQGIDKFADFRQLLITLINQLKNSHNDNPEERLSLIKRFAQNSLIENDEDEKPKGLFESETAAEQFEKEYYALLTYFENYLECALLEWKEKIKSSIETLLLDYFNIDNDNLEVDFGINPSKGVINVIDGITKEMEHEDIHPFVKFDINIKTARGNLTSDKRFPIKPRQYLNTFRFKLFCVAIKIVLGCFVKKTYEINHPFVIDDVFDSSDFDSRLQLKQFVEKIVECHNGLLSDDKYTMQFLFFTQDDLIANQVNKGLIASTGVSNVKYERIYDYHDADDYVSYIDNKLRNNKDNNNKYISLENISDRYVLE